MVPYLLRTSSHFLTEVGRHLSLCTLPSYSSLTQKSQLLKTSFVGSPIFLGLTTSHYHDLNVPMWYTPHRRLWNGGCHSDGSNLNFPSYTCFPILEIIYSPSLTPNLTVLELPEWSFLNPLIPNPLSSLSLSERVSVSQKEGRWLDYLIPSFYSEVLFSKRFPLRFRGYPGCPRLRRRFWHLYSLTQ